MDKPPTDDESAPVQHGGVSQSEFIAGLCTGYVLGNLIGFDSKAFLPGLACAALFWIARRVFGTRVAVWLAAGAAILIFVFEVGFRNTTTGLISFLVVLSIAGALAIYEVSNYAAGRDEHSRQPETAPPVPGSDAPLKFDPWQGRAPKGPFLTDVTSSQNRGGGAGR